MIYVAFANALNLSVAATLAEREDDNYVSLAGLKFSNIPTHKTLTILDLSETGQFQEQHKPELLVQFLKARGYKSGMFEQINLILCDMNPRVGLAVFAEQLAEILEMRVCATTIQQNYSTTKLLPPNNSTQSLWQLLGFISSDKPTLIWEGKDIRELFREEFKNIFLPSSSPSLSLSL